MKNILVETLKLTSTGFLGLLVGALLAEGFIFVPYWKSLPSETFFSLHKEYGVKLYRFFAPLTIAATILPITSAFVTLFAETPIRWWNVIAGVLAFSMMAIYMLYFKNANAKFAEAKISSAELAIELNVWANRHWIRVIAGICAFAASLVGLSG